MLKPESLLRQARFLLSLAVLGGAGALALPAHALQGGTPPMLPMPPEPPAAGMPAPPSPETLGLDAAQTRLLQTARAVSREARAHALELRARFERERGDDAPDAPLRPRLQAADQLHDAIEQERRAVRERWLALDDSLDAGQRARLRATPEAAHWLGLQPPAPHHGPVPIPAGCGPR